MRLDNKQKSKTGKGKSHRYFRHMGLLSIRLLAGLARETILLNESVVHEHTREKHPDKNAEERIFDVL